MNRRGFLKVALGGVALAALPAAASTPPATPAAAHEPAHAAFSWMLGPCLLRLVTDVGDYDFDLPPLKTRQDGDSFSFHIPGPVTFSAERDMLITDMRVVSKVYPSRWMALGFGGRQYIAGGPHNTVTVVPT